MNSATLAWAVGCGGLGLLVGSFLGLVSVRWPLGEPIVAGRSRCRGCGRPLGVLDLVPVLSFLFLRGRCRTCGAPIDSRYPLLEAACAVIGVWAALLAPGPAALVSAGLGFTLVLLAVLDMEHFWLPDALTLGLLCAGLVQAALSSETDLAGRLIGAGVGFSSLALVAIAYRAWRGREGMGGGDPKLLAAAGAWVGWIGVPSVVLWAAAAALSMVGARAALGRRVRPDDRAPFGAYLALGLWLTWLYGPLGL